MKDEKLVENITKKIKNDETTKYKEKSINEFVDKIIVYYLIIE